MQNFNRYLEFHNDFCITWVKISLHVSLRKGRNKFAYLRNHDTELRPQEPSHLEIERGTV